MERSPFQVPRVLQDILAIDQEYLRKLFSSGSKKDAAVLILLAKDCEYARDSITFAQEQHVQHMITMLVALLSRRAEILEKEELEKGPDISSSK